MSWARPFGETPAGRTALSGYESPETQDEEPAYDSNSLEARRGRGHAAAKKPTPEDYDEILRKLNAEGEAIRAGNYERRAPRPAFYKPKIGGHYAQQDSQ